MFVRDEHVRTGTVLVLLSAGCRAGAFACEHDEQCRDGEALGVCQPAGVCSFPDDACASGQRFGAHSGELSGRCVPGAGTTSGASESSTSRGAETIAGTLDPSSSEPASTANGSTSGELESGPSESSDATASSTGEPEDPSLLLWFRFEDELADGLANDGRLGGDASCMGETCPSPIEGAVGSGASFDGLDDCGTFAFVPELGAEQFTLAMWARRDVAVAGFDAAFTKPVGKMPYNTWRMTVQGDEMLGELLNVHVGLADDMGIDGYAPLPLGVWTHFAATWTGDALTTYLDGELLEELPSSLIEIDEQPVFVGCDDDHLPSGLAHFLHGALDDVRMYDRVLDEAEIAELHALATP